MKKLVIFLIGFFVLSMLQMPAMASGVDILDTPKTVESFTLDSPHYYSNNYDKTWTITESGASQIRVYFRYLRTETNYDYVYVYDYNGQLMNTYTGTKDNTWSSFSYGDTIYVRLVTDYSVTKWGFRITQIDYEAGGIPADTTAPSVDITSPTNGATISGTTTISCSATDANGISSRAIKIDGTTVSTSSSYSWNTASYSDGSHSIQCTATDPSGNTGTDTISVTVDNAPSGGDWTLTSGVTETGSLASTSAYDTWTIDVDADATNMHVVLTSGSSDFDIFASHYTSSPTHTNNEFEGYTSGGEDINFANPGAGTWYIVVDAYSGTGAYSLTVTVTYGTGGGSGDWGTGGKYAVIWGISNYQSISDLSYCDDDARDVYNYLTGKGYEVKTFGDNTNSYYGYEGLATEGNVRAAIQSLASHAQAGDEVVIWASSHGGATGTYDGAWQYSGSSYTGDNPGTGYSYLLMWDFSSSPSTSNEFSTSDESYSAGEMRQDFESFASGVNIFLGIDACQSGGFGYELAQSTRYSNWYLALACGVNGYGYDASQYSNGMFTYWYLERGLIAQGTTNAHTAFIYADGQYNPSNAADTFREYMGLNFYF
ncbi:MAG: pre-peptidase C-terminal domain-containing protein [Candidatus Heimdallarchaeota archaeon]|nr:pre-peptidase C-terminal domain-containing protein [Candidatus Heimdallarchaeota archaeon]